MSAERKFQLVQERIVGTLPKKLQEKWQRLNERRARLDKQTSNFEKATRKFFEEIAGGIVEEGATRTLKGMRLGDDGTLYELLCECHTCQADLYGVSVASVVEEMIRQDLIHPQEIDSARQHAAEVDSSKHAAGKKHLLFN